MHVGPVPTFLPAARRVRAPNRSSLDMTAPRLEFRNVTKRFANPDGDATTAIAGVTFSVADGEVVSLIGPSGCGKSTLLNLGSGLDQPSAGEVSVDGERVAKPNPHVAF